MQSFCPSLTAPAGQFSTQRPQATQLSLSTLAAYALRDRFGVLNSCDVRSALQTLTLQLQMPKIFCSLPKYFKEVPDNE